MAFASPFSGNGSYADVVERGTIALQVGREGGREGGREEGREGGREEEIEDTEH